MKPSVTISLAKSTEQRVVEGFYLAMLRELEPFGHDIAPTEENAKRDTQHRFMPAATRGEPVLVARIGPKAVGALFWHVTSGMGFGYGTYVLPEYRHTGIGSQLRREGIERFKQLGVKKIVGSALPGNEIGHASLTKLGFKPSCTLYALNL